MKTRFLLTLILGVFPLISLGGFTGCDRRVPGVDPRIDPKEDALTISSNEVAFEAMGGTKVLDVQTNVEKVETRCEVDWLTIVYAQKHLTLTATANDATQSRETVLKVIAGTATKEIRVSQAAKVNSNPTPSGFVSDAKDFPLFLKKNIDKYTDAEIKDYEQKLGLRPTCNPQGGNLEFTTTPETQGRTNFYRVVYERVGKNVDIVAYSKSVKSVESLEEPAKKQWLENNGFSFVKTVTYSGLTVYNYTNKEQGFTLLVAARGNSECFFVFTYGTSGGDDPAPDPNKKREALYIPFFEAFGKPISGDSPIIQLEKNRKFKAEFKAGDLSTTPPVQPEIMALPPFDVEYARPNGAGKAGISSISYSKTKADTEDVVTIISVGFNTAWNKTQISDDALFREFLQGNGFEFKSQENVNQYMMKGTLYTYYNATNKVLASYFIDKSGASYAASFVTFTQDDSFSSAARLREVVLRRR